MNLRIETSEHITIKPQAVNNEAGNMVELNIDSRSMERIFYDIWEEIGSEGLKKWIEGEGCIFVDKDNNN